MQEEEEDSEYDESSQGLADDACSDNAGGLRGTALDAARTSMAKRAFVALHEASSMQKPSILANCIDKDSVDLCKDDASDMQLNR